MARHKKNPESHARKWLPMIREFMANVQIDSKETGVGPLEPYDAQLRFLDEICIGLDGGVRFFVNLKSRQLGITTVSLVVDLFWLFVHPGLQGALITDTEDNKEVFRTTIDRYIEGLPPRYKVGVDKHNRTQLKLKNGSVLQYLVAGSRGNKNLGTSRALNFVHATEVSKWGDSVGMSSLLNSLAEQFPDRLYIFESTANGFNQFYSMWMAAQEDNLTQRAFFIGWWAKEIHRIERSDPRYEKYMADPPTPEEKEKAAIVEAQYRHIVTPEQLAWYRWRSDTRSPGEGSMEQEQPWHEVEAFIETGKSFFPAKALTADLKRVMDGKSVLLKGFRYFLGDQFTQTELDVMELDQVAHSSTAELRIWHEPRPHARYVIGVDPAYGRTDWGDSHGISVWRCYADKLVQVAEYATPDQETYQVIWVLAHLAGIYRDCIINLEVNGPGTTIMQGIKHLKAQLMAEVGQKGVPQMPASDRALIDAIQAARWYLYHRPDSMGSGYVYGWKTTADNKLAVMNQLRDTYMLRNMIVNSGPLLQQMKTIRQDGIEICAAGKQKDDRVFAAAFAHKAWIEWVRPSMVAQMQTYAAVTEREIAAAAQPDMPNDTLVGGIVRRQFEKAAANRRNDAIQSRFNRRF